MSDGSGGFRAKYGTALVVLGIGVLVLCAGVVPAFADGPRADGPRTDGPRTDGSTDPGYADVGGARNSPGDLTPPITRYVYPTATYLHTNRDDAGNATPIALSEVGADPGDVVRIERLGDYEKPSTGYGMTGMFSSNATLLSGDRRERVPGAVDAGEDFATSATYWGSEPTDVPEDFLISNGDATNNATDVTVPEGARYLFVSPKDNLFEDNGDTDEDFRVRITVVDRHPTASLNVSPIRTSAGKSVTLDASGATDPDGSIVEYRWDFRGDGAVDRTTTRPRIDHTYSSQGSYAPTVTVVDDGNATDRASGDLVVTPPEPVARCTAIPTAAAVNETVTIDASASEHADVYRYDFDGDGTPDTDFLTTNRTTTTYRRPGTYAPAVTAYNYSSDASDTATCGNVTVARGNQPPTAQFTYSPRPAIAGRRTTLNASNASDPDGTIVSYAWDFDGDGTIDETTNDSVTTHVFDYDETAPGLGTVAVTVTDDDGATDRTSRDVEIDRPPPEPVARCTARSGEVVVGETVRLDAAESSHADTYRWDVDGDGTLDTDSYGNPVYEASYDRPGTYSPAVRVRNTTSGATDGAACGNVTVVPAGSDNRPPTARFTQSSIQAATGSPVRFDASASNDSDGKIVEYRWDFDGDGTIDRTTTRPRVNHTYRTAGSYGPTLTVVDDDGATDRTTRDVVVERGNRPPHAVVDHSPPLTSPGTNVTLNASGSWDDDGRVVAYRWDFGADGTVDATTKKPTITHRFDATGNESVRVIAVDDDGATDSVVERVAVRNCGCSTGGLPIPSIPAPAWVAGGLIGGGGAGYLASRGRDWGPALHLLHLLHGLHGSSTPGAVTAHAAGTFETPSAGEDAVTVAGLGFEPDLLLFTATSQVGSGDGPTRTDGWSYGKAQRNADGSIEQNVVSVADDSRSPDAAVGAARDGAVLDVLTYGESSGPGADGDEETGPGADGGEVAGGLAGRIERTTADGFEVRFDDSAVPGAGSTERYTVLFEAFETTGDAVDVGHVFTPATPGTQSVPLDVDADVVAITACNAVDELDAATVTDRMVGVSHGTAVAREDGTPVQQSVTSALDPHTVYRNSYAAYDDRAVTLLHGGEEGVDGRTTARVTDLGETIELTYDEVYAPGAGVETPSTDGPGAGGAGADEPAAADGGVVGEATGGDAGVTRNSADDPTAPGEAARNLLTYVAVDAGGARPSIGNFRAPAPDGDEQLRVDVGSRPEVVTFTACNVDRVGGERTVDDSPLSFGWSHGVSVADGTRDGRVDQYLLHGSLDPDGVVHVGDHGDGFGGATDAGTSTHATEITGQTGRSRAADVAGPAGTTSGVSTRSDLPVRTAGGPVPRPAGWPPGVATSLALDDCGRVVGRDVIGVAAVTDTAFEIRVADVSSERREGVAPPRPIVFYTAWPPTDQ